MGSNNSLIPVKPWWQTLVETIVHAAVGGGLAYFSVWSTGSHVDPATAAAVGSAISSVGSAYFRPPNQP